MIWIWSLVAALLIINWLALGALSSRTMATQVSIPYSVFRAQVQTNNVASVTAMGETIAGELRHAIRYPAGKSGQSSKEFKTERPVFAGDQIFQQLLADGATVGAKPPTTATPLWQTLLFGFGPTVLLVGLFVLLMRRASRSLSGGAGSVAGFGKARARRYEPTEQRTTFKDVAGIDEATDELAEIVDFLKHPEHYGGRAAEELTYGAVTTGAESDLEQATALARHMVGRWGMSRKIGLVTVLPADGVGPFALPGEGLPSEHTRQIVDSEVRRLTDECHAQALDTLREHRKQLDALARALLERETLDEPDAYAAAGIPHAKRANRHQSRPERAPLDSVR